MEQEQLPSVAIESKGSKGLFLTRDQNDAVSFIEDRLIENRTRVQAQLTNKETSEYPHPWMKSPRIANAVGVFGRRGAGKSTVLVEILVRMQEREKMRALRMPVDCSLCPRDIPLGMTLVQSLWSSLHCDEKTLSQCPDHRADQACEKAFNGMIAVYAKADPSVHGLASSLAISSSSYAVSIRREITDRLKLPRLIAEWLEEESRRCKVDTFVLGLDDVDLARGGQAANLLWSLLDELHQPRIFFLCAADLEQWLRALKEPPSGFESLSNPTARELLAKIIPQESRAFLLPWAIEEREAFPTGVPKIRKLSVLMDPRLKEYGPEIRNLVPPFPRGLENLYHQLLLEDEKKKENEKNKKEKAEVDKGKDEGGKTDDGARHTAELSRRRSTFLTYLAEARQEHEIAARLPRRGIHLWAPAFDWPQSSIGAVAWRDLVEAARSPMAEAPLSAILPNQGSIPFEDAGEDGPFWFEVLVNLALEQRTLRPWDLGFRIKSLDERLEASCFEVERTFARLIEERDWEKKSWEKECFWTIYLPTSEKTKVVTRVGWRPLVKALIRDRQIFPASILGRLMLGTTRSATHFTSTFLPKSSDRREAIEAFSPLRLRSLVLFVHELYSAPWRTVVQQASVGHSTAGLVRLSALFVSGALSRALGSWEESFRSWHAFATAGDAPEYIDWGDGKVQNELDEITLLKVPLVSEKDLGPTAKDLHRCLVAFHESPLFKGLATKK